MTGLRKLALVFGGVVLLILLVVGAYLQQMSNLPLPRHDGEYAVPGLRAQVEVLRDEWGVPHIYADNPYDLFFAQGFVQAQDRWWQMEFSRHLSQGRLGELVGTSALASDVQIRAWGLRRVAEEEWATYDLDSSNNLQAFADGVNAYVNGRDRSGLAFEYNALRLAGMDITVRQWSPVDTLAYAKFVSYGLSANADLESIYTDLLATLGPEMAADFLPDFPYGDKPTILHSEVIPLSDEHVRLVPTPEPAPGVPVDGQAAMPGYQDPGIGSNNWVVHGRLTRSGKPLLANDPHLPIGLPSIWYEIGLHCNEVSEACPYNVTGFTFSPFPGVAVGHNESIAWGVTVAGPDVQDLYRIRVNPGDPFQYEWNGEWRDMLVYEEEFAFADGTAARTLPMRVTHLGPIVNDYAVDADTGEIGPLNQGNPQALRWTALEPEPFFKAIFALDRATNWHKFREALRFWTFGAMNFVYADILGNIGYQMPGRIPIRAEGHTGMTIVPGWTDAYEWQGYIPYDRLPRLFDPPEGYIITANQKVVPPAYWSYLASELGAGADYDFQEIWPVYGYRAERIRELLQQGRPHTVLSFEEMQADNLLINGRELLPYLEGLALEDPAVAGIRDWLLRWDHRLDVESGQGAFYAIFWRHLLDNLYNDNLGELPPARALHMWPTTRLLADPENVWWDDARTPEVVETRDDILARTLVDAHRAALAELGEDRALWRWGDLHTATFKSLPLGESGITPLEGVVNRGPYAVAGGANVVNATAWSQEPGDYFGVSGMPSMRMVIDLAQFGGSTSMNSTGQSGHVASEHYDDMIEPWQMNQYHPMLWSRAQVELEAVSQLLLNPPFAEGTECCQR